MKISIDRLSLASAIKNIRSACGKSRTDSVALEGILLEEMECGNKVKLTATDLELGMQTTADLIMASDNGEKFETIIPPTAITAILKLKGELVHMEIVETGLNNLLEIVSGNAKFKFSTVPVKDYPNLPKIEESEAITMPQPTLKSMIQQTIFAVSTDEYRPALTGVLFDITETQISAVALDGYRVASRKENIQTGKDLRCIIPSKTLNSVVKLLSNNEDELVTMHIGGKYVTFSVGEYTAITRTLEGESIDYQSYLESNTDISVRVNTQDVIDSLERTALLISHNVREPVKCNFTYDGLILSCTTTVGSIKEKIDINKRGNDVEIGFNSSYFLDALRATECDEVLLELQSGLSPMKIVPVNGNDFTFLVLPMRLKR